MFAFLLFLQSIGNSYSDASIMQFKIKPVCTSPLSDQPPPEGVRGCSSCPCTVGGKVAVQGFYFKMHPILLFLLLLENAHYFRTRKLKCHIV